MPDQVGYIETQHLPVHQQRQFPVVRKHAIVGQNESLDVGSPQKVLRRRAFRSACFLIVHEHNLLNRNARANFIEPIQHYYPPVASMFGVCESICMSAALTPHRTDAGRR